MTFINDLPAGHQTAALRRNIAPSAMFHDQYFGHNAVATNLATMV
jgi:hypothetical protein